jgi:biotin transporter BioY
MAAFDRRPPPHPAWYLVAFVVAAFVAGVIIRWWRTGAVW